LEEVGANIRKTISFSDHYQYKKSDLERLLKLARKKNLQLVTTKKDWARMDEIYKNQIKFLDIKIELNNKQKIIKMLKDIKKI
jgi:tetraacyldisaccharide 4'-kinase